MTHEQDTVGIALVRSVLGDAAPDAVATLDLQGLALDRDDGRVSRTILAAALNIVLFRDLLDRVPTAAAYVGERRAAGETIRLDHGALRTIRFPHGSTGALPAGETAFSRFLLPLGYELAGVYPLPKLRMTGRAYRHRDAPEAMPQFFVSELHVEQFDDAVAQTARRVFDAGTDPVGPDTLAALSRLDRDGALPFDQAVRVLADLVGAFDRQHPVPALADYDILHAASAEAAWIATEGNAFNHATDRVADIEQLAHRERLAGRPIKDRVEVSASGRVRQTAHRAATVTRAFRDEAGATVHREVPGSFYEFITRDIDPATGAIDLRFDSANATGIFAMTKVA